MVMPAKMEEVKEKEVLLTVAEAYTKSKKK